MPHTINAVTSKDGTKIGYRQYGHGPGLIAVQGAMGTAHNYDQLATALANDFTVYVPDRRGRGMSPASYSAAYSIQKEVEDLESMLEQTDAHFLFGLSSGAIITLEAARVLPSIHKAALYEPPFYFGGGFPMEMMARFNREISQRKLAAALVTLGKIVRLGPAPLNFVPRPILELLTRGVLHMEKKEGSKYASLQELIPATRFDLKVVSGMDGKAPLFKLVKAEMLLLGGSESPTYLKNALDGLEKILPSVCRENLEGLDHSGPWNADKGGNPNLIAKSLHHFFRL